ncbi:phBC6A51 family helix-turn-helix protein [Tuberibacillus calidus]|uniref:phBC6A51 family helix-turn-helix protein n=1 Tax=Tuberibacillus calidus TaxID=340097 RepID=UPI00040D981B|nr:phBC6A51 family helix-turn-helix protein [Tuberibacillus calidus]
MEILDDRKILAIELLADGEYTKTEIAKKCGIARQTLYDWLDNDLFRAELDRRLQQKKSLVQKKIDGKLDFVIEKLYELANDSSNKRVQAQVLQYLADRALGKPTSKHEIEAAMNDKNNIDEDILEAEFDEVDNEDEE